MQKIKLWIVLITSAGFVGCSTSQVVQNTCVVEIENAGVHPISKLTVVLSNSQSVQTEHSFEQVDSGARVKCAMSGSDIIVEVKSYSIIGKEFHSDFAISIAPIDRPVLKIGSDGVITANY